MFQLCLCSILYPIRKLFLEKTKHFTPTFKLLARKVRYFAINRYFCELKTRML